MSLDMHDSPSRAETESEPTMGSLVKGIVADLETLWAQQWTLFRREVRDDLQQACAAATMLCFGAAVLLLAGTALVFAIVYAVQAAFPTLSLEVCFTIVGVSLAVIGGALLYGGMRLFAAIDPIPTRSVEALQENVQCILTTPKTWNDK